MIVHKDSDTPNNSRNETSTGLITAFNKYPESIREAIKGDRKTKVKHENR